jgi:4-diphosphocytidyl-2-C-methyl-D-erythritol kinase
MLFLPAYAKLNLALCVVGRRPDGRHDLRSVVVRLDWHDLVGVASLADAGEVRLRVTGPEAAAAPPAPSNLAARAATALLAERPGAGLLVHLEKRLPAAAGLGGGSADAAAVLQILIDQGSATVSFERLAGLADALGSDVPGCLAGGGLLVGGAGERLERIDHRPLHLAVALAGRSGTPETFAALRPEEWRGPARAEELARLLCAGRLPTPELCGSDLEAAACRSHPDLAGELDRLRRGVPRAVWHLTGSGGACFALAADHREAAALARSAASLGFPARACRTVAACGPLPVRTMPPSGCG